MLAPVILLVTMKFESERIVLKYSVENKSGAEIFLINHLTRYEPGKGWIPDAQVIYVAMEDQNVIELAKRIPPVPENRLVTPRDYYVTPLPDGDRFEEELTLPIPLREHRPYDALIEPIPEPRDVEASLTFSLGYFEALPHLEAKKVVVHGVTAFDLVLRTTAAVTKQIETATAPREKILTSDPTKAKLRVISLPMKARN